MASVTYRNVTKRWGDVEAVKNLSIEIPDGEFLVFVGPSGCGKSTSLRMLAGLEEITEGEILIGDRVVNNVAPKDRDIAMVFQSYALYPHMTVYDNMAFGLRLRRTPKHVIDERVREVAASLGIENLLDRRPRQLSGGQRQRVAVGRAIVREPAVFLLDEPLSNLDAKLRVQMRAELKRFHQELRATVIYVTHDQLEAMTMADKIAVMNGGVLQQYGSPDEIYSRPVNVFVAGFIGSPSMNFLRGRVTSENGVTSLVGDGWQIPLSAANAHRAHASSGDLIVGARHNQIHLSHQPAPGALPAQVYTSEPTGDLTFVHVQVGPHLVVASVDPSFHVSPDDRIWVSFDQDSLHLFDAQTETALPPAEAVSSVTPRAAARV